MLYLIIDFKTKTLWATFDDANKNKIIKFFNSINNEDLTVVTLENGKEIKRESYTEFEKATNIK